MNRQFLLAFLILMALIGRGQKQYAGYIYDVGTMEPLSDVFIQSPYSGLSTSSDLSGYFNIQLSPLGSSKGASNSYAVTNNTVYWNLGSNVTLFMYSMDGTTVLSVVAPKSGNYNLPVLSAAYYVLHIQTDQETISFMLFSDGINYTQVSKKDFTPPAPAYDSSLVFSKSGYYPQEVELERIDETAEIPMLRTSYDDIGYFTQLISYEAFYMLHSSPPISNYGEIQSIKAVYDFKADVIYYLNVNKYPNHYSFAEDVLDYSLGIDNFFWSQYNNSPDRFLYLISINYHENIDKYVFEFNSWDLADCGDVEKAYDKIIETSFIEEKLFFHVNNLRWQNCDELPFISSEDLFLGQNYQALNLEENYGYLRKVYIEDLSSTYLGRHDVVLLNGIPNDLSVVAGIITTEFQTPLSHINVLSHNRHTPNMALKDGWTNPILDSLFGELVYLNVDADSFIIRKANLDEAMAFWLENEPQEPITLEKDIETSGIRELADESYLSVKSIGGKAANFAEMVNLGSIPVPEMYFAIPFYYYHQHMVTHGFDTIISNMLEDEEFSSNLEYRKNKLAELRSLIINATIDPEIVSLVLNRIDNFLLFGSFRFRSSTNAEDLEGFNGAGLYDSYSAKRNHNSKTVDMAIKKVWASLWNLRAFEEREYFLIDHLSVAMGILVHRSFPDEDVNGVIITHNPYSNNHGYLFSAQFKEFSIVDPDPGILHDQIIVYTIGVDSIPYTIEYLMHSNIPGFEGQTVLSDEEIYEIADYCTTLKEYYYEHIPHNCNCDYNSFALDIEFKVDSDVQYRKVYLKQVRPYGSD